MIQLYNTHMGGVDRMDQNVAKYRIGIRIKKWWWPLLAYLLDVSMQNAWILYRGTLAYQAEKLSLLQFRRRVCLCYFQRYTNSRVIGRPPGRPQILDRRVPPEVRYNGAGHYMHPSATQRRCAQCKGKVYKICIKCGAPLHTGCFVAFHIQ